MKHVCMTLTLLILMSALSVFTLPAFSEGNIGFSYTAGGGQTDIGVLGHHEQPLGPGDIAIDATVKIGNGVDMTADADYTVPVYKSLGLRPYIAFVGKGTSFSAVGGNLDGGTAINFRIGDVDIGGGLFGRASAEFAPTLRDELLAAGVDGVTAELLNNPGLDAPATDGLPILKPDTPLHITLYTELDWHRFDIGLQWMGEASLDTPIHQYRVDVGTAFHLPFGQLGLQGNLIAQSHAGTFDGEYNLTANWGLRWP